MRKGRQIDLRKHIASAIINSRFRRKTPCPQRGSWECWLAGSNRVDLSPPASLRIRNPSPVRRRFPNPGRFDRCLRTFRPLDTRVSYLSRFLMCRPPPEGGFLFTSSRFGLLRSGVPERSAFLAVHTSPPGLSPPFDFDSPRSRIVTLLSPCSPFGPVLALLPLPFLGRSQLQYPPSPVAGSTLLLSQYLHRIVLRIVGRLFTIRLL